MNAVIAVERLTKTFGNVRALDGLSLEIPQGGVYGILGPNGAGKSTLFRILLGLIEPSEGRAEVLGFPVRTPETLRRMGSMIETPRYPPYMTARESLQWLALAHGMGQTAAIDPWLERVGLTEAADRKVRGFSVGMLQRLGVAAALMTGPEVVILDEPTSGMDPNGIQDMRALIRSLADDDGVTVVIASHQLLEVQKICDRVAIFNRGKLAAEGLVSDLTAETEYLRLAASPLQRVAEIVGESGTIVGDAININIRRQDTPALIAHLVSQDIAVMEARWIGADLEAVFMSQTAGAESPLPPTETVTREAHHAD